MTDICPNQMLFPFCKLSYHHKECIKPKTSLHSSASVWTRLNIHILLPIPNPYITAVGKSVGAFTFASFPVLLAPCHLSQRNCDPGLCLPGKRRNFIAANSVADSDWIRSSICRIFRYEATCLAC